MTSLAGKLPTNLVGDQRPEATSPFVSPSGRVSAHFTFAVFITRERSRSGCEGNCRSQLGQHCTGCASTMEEHETRAHLAVKRRSGWKEASKSPHDSQFMAPSS